MLSSKAGSRIAADVGGTFTDIATFDEESGSIKLGKCLTTPSHLIDGIVDGVEKAGASFDQANLFLHGTTVAINTILERSGAKTALADDARLSAMSTRSAASTGPMPTTCSSSKHRAADSSARGASRSTSGSTARSARCWCRSNEAAGARRSALHAAGARASNRWPMHVPALLSPTPAHELRVKRDPRGAPAPACS